MTDIDKKIDELKEFTSISEKEIEYIKNKVNDARKSIKKLERIKSEIAEIVMWERSFSYTIS